jgi:hypothetical protein
MDPNDAQGWADANYSGGGFGDSGYGYGTYGGDGGSQGGGDGGSDNLGSSKDDSSKNGKSNIPDWAIPYLKKVGDESVNLYDSGALSRVAGTNRNLDRTFGLNADQIDEQTRRAISNLTGSQDRLTQMAMSGGYDTRALKDKAILQAQMETAKLGQQYGAGGTLGSARQSVQQGAQNAATAAEFANIDYDAAQRNFQNRMAAEEGLGRASSDALDASRSGAEAMGAIGMAERGIEQEGLDAPWQGLQRYSSAVYGNPARNVQKQEGGK